MEVGVNAGKELGIQEWRAEARYENATKRPPREHQVEIEWSELCKDGRGSEEKE